MGRRLKQLSASNWWGCCGCRMAGNVKDTKLFWRSRRSSGPSTDDSRRLNGNAPTPRINARPQPRPLEDEDGDEDEVSWSGLSTCIGIQAGTVPLPLLNISSVQE